jgi:hypothetical protein
MSLWGAVVVLVSHNSHDKRLRAVLVKKGRQSFSQVLLQLMAQQQSSTTSKADFEQGG